MEHLLYSTLQNRQILLDQCRPVHRGFSIFFFLADNITSYVVDSFQKIGTTLNITQLFWLLRLVRNDWLLVHTKSRVSEITLSRRCRNYHLLIPATIQPYLVTRSPLSHLITLTLKKRTLLMRRCLKTKQNLWNPWNWNVVKMCSAYLLRMRFAIVYYQIIIKTLHE